MDCGTQQTAPGLLALLVLQVLRVLLEQLALTVLTESIVGILTEMGQMILLRI
jgi:hypothetical protein